MLCEEQCGHTTDTLIRRAFGNVNEALLACRGAQVERWWRPTVRGERVCSIAITEHGAGSDGAGISTKATLDADGGWHLSGHKRYISDGLVSDFCLVSAVTGDREISLFLVDQGPRGTSHVELWFDDVTRNGESPLGERGHGFRMAMEVPGRVVDRAVEIVGGMGDCKDLPVECWYRDARIHRIFDSPSAIHRGRSRGVAASAGRQCASRIARERPVDRGDSAERPQPLPMRRRTEAG